MAWVYAGEYSGDIIYQTRGPVALVDVAITTDGTTPATLYAGAAKGAPLPGNTVRTDGNGNLAFFADPGTYTVTVPTGGTFPAVVPVSPLEFPTDPDGLSTYQRTFAV